MPTPSILALDVGAQRVGVAVASFVARLPHPVTALQNDEGLWQELAGIIEAENVQHIVVGNPRGLQGQSTAQTAETEAFVSKLLERFELPITQLDEAMTSQKAEAELQSRGKPYAKGDIDALAATYILEDYFAGAPG